MSANKLRAPPGSVPREAIENLDKYPKIYDSFGFNAIAAGEMMGGGGTSGLRRPKLQLRGLADSMTANPGGVDTSRSDSVLHAGQSNPNHVTLPPIQRTQTYRERGLHRTRSMRGIGGMQGAGGGGSGQGGFGPESARDNIQETPAQKRERYLQQLGISLPPGTRPDPELEEFLRLVESEAIPASELRWRYNVFRIKYRSKEEENETSQYYSLIQDATQRITDCISTYEMLRREEEEQDESSDDDVDNARPSPTGSSGSGSGNATTTAAGASSTESHGMSRSDMLAALRARIDDEINRLLKAEKQRKEEKESLAEGINATLENVQTNSKLDEKLIEMAEIEQQTLAQQLELVRLAVDEDRKEGGAKLAAQLEKLRMLIKRVKTDESRLRELSAGERAALAMSMGASGTNASATSGRGSLTGISLDAAVLAQMRQQLRDRDVRVAQLEDLIRKLGAVVPPITGSSGGSAMSGAQGSRTGSANAPAGATAGTGTADDKANANAAVGTGGATSASAAEAIALARIQDLERRNQNLKVEVDRLAARLREFKSISGAAEIVKELEKELEYQRQRSKEAEMAQEQLDKLVAMRTTTVQQNHALTRRNTELERRVKELEGKLRDISYRNKEEAAASAAATAAALAAAGASVGGASSSQSALQQLHAQYQELEKSLAEKSDEIQSLQATIASLEEERNALRIERESLAHALITQTDTQQAASSTATKGSDASATGGATANSRVGTAGNSKSVEAVGVKGNMIKCGKCNTFVIVPASFRGSGPGSTAPAASAAAASHPPQPKGRASHGAASKEKDNAALVALKEEKERLEKERARERRENEELKTEIAELKSKNISANAAASMFSAKEKQLQDQLQSAQMQNAALKRLSQAHEKQAQECKRIAEEAEAAAEKARSELENAKKMVNTLQFEVESFTERQADLLSKIVMLQKAEELHTEAIRKFQAANDELQAARHRDKASLEQAKRRIAQLEEALSETTRQLETLSAESSSAAAAAALAEQARKLREEQSRYSSIDDTEDVAQEDEASEKYEEGTGGSEVQVDADEVAMNLALEAAAAAAAAAKAAVTTTTADSNAGDGPEGSGAASSTLQPRYAISQEDTLGTELLERISQLAKNQALVVGMGAEQAETSEDLHRLQREFQSLQTMLSQYTAERALLQQRLGNALGALETERLRLQSGSREADSTEASSDVSPRHEDPIQGESEGSETSKSDTRNLKRIISELEIENAQLKSQLVDYEARLLNEPMSNEDDDEPDSKQSKRITALEEEVRGLRWLVEQREREAEERANSEKMWQTKYEDLKAKYDALLVKFKELDDLKGQGLKLDPSVIGMSPEEILRNFAAAASAYQQQRQKAASTGATTATPEATASGPSTTDLSTSQTDADGVLIAAAEGVRQMVEEVRTRDAIRARSSVMKPWRTAGGPNIVDSGPTEEDLRELTITGQSSAVPSRATSPAPSNRAGLTTPPAARPHAPSRAPSRASTRGGSKQAESRSGTPQATRTPTSEPNQAESNYLTVPDQAPTHEPTSEGTAGVSSPPPQDERTAKPTSYSTVLDVLTKSGALSASGAAAAAAAAAAKAHGGSVGPGVFSVSSVFASRKSHLERKATERESLVGIAAEENAQPPAEESGWNRVASDSSAEASAGSDSLVKLYELQLTNQFDP